MQEAMKLYRNPANAIAAALGDYLRRDGTDAGMTGTLKLNAQGIGNDSPVLTFAAGAAGAALFAGNVDLNGNRLILDVDGDTYIVSEVDDEISIYINGATTYGALFNADWIGGYGGSRAGFRANVNPSATVASVCPGKNDADTGIGRAAADQPCMIGGEIEAQRWIPKVDADSDLNDILLTAVSGFHGIALVTSLTDNVSALYHIDNVTITGVISANALFSNTPANAGTYNFYYDVDQFKLENKVGNNKSVQVIFWVVPT